MHPIPIKLKKEILADPYYKQCARKDRHCKGRITFEHALIYAGRQIQEKWAIIPLCAYHHSVDKFQDGGGLDKRINERIAVSRATPEDLAKYPKRNWKQYENKN